MSETCNQSCTSCSEDCADRKEEQPDFKAKLNEMSNVKKVYAIVSGKGGVGKSLVTSMMATTMARMDYRTAILDADVTGPSIPKMFGIKEKAKSNGVELYPVRTKTGIDVMSVNLLLENDTDPVIWRGPVIAGAVKQFWTDVIWENIDFMFIDMPPGTGDIPLTVFQSLAVDGIIVVTSPQELVSMIVSKAVGMAEKMDIPVIGLVENMSYFKCPDNDKNYHIFGESHIDEIAEKYGLEILAKIPIDPRLSAVSDKGMIELFDGDWVNSVGEMLARQMEGEDNGKSEQDDLDGQDVENVVRRDDMIKIAVASERDVVTEHFGHCINFNIYEAENGKILRSESIANPGHKPGFLPNYLNDLGVNVIISGGMGGGAIEIFNEKEIEVIVGASGDAKSAAQAYLSGDLKSTGSVCHDHKHQSECGH
ncbi:MAG TPA: iron-sulfur cluster carrier protein MrpORP [Anaerovoracaceae bacterium]|nr:iron-sulfur cluster carrier protein MrpORP [Anaerovoracaceae bacterium]